MGEEIQEAVVETPAVETAADAIPEATPIPTDDEIRNALAAKINATCDEAGYQLEARMVPQVFLTKKEVK